MLPALYFNALQIGCNNMQQLKAFNPGLPLQYNSLPRFSLSAGTRCCDDLPQ